MLIWSFNFVAAKIGLRHMDVISFASIRMPLAALLMLPIYFAQGRRTPLARQDIWTFVCLGFFGVVINSGCFVLGLTQTTSEHSVIVRALGPVLVLALAVALRVEGLTLGKAAGMLISFAGVILLDAERGVSMRSPLLLGDVYTFLSIAGFAIYTVFAKRIAMRYDAVSMNTYTVAAAGLMALPVALRQTIHLRWGGVGPLAMDRVGGHALHGVGDYRRVLHNLQLGAPTYGAVEGGGRQLRAAGGGDPDFDPSARRASDGNLVAGGALVLAGVYLTERAK